MTAVSEGRAPLSLRQVLSFYPLIIGGLVLAIPTIITLGGQVWSTESGAYGPIVLFTGIWVLGRRWDDFVTNGRPGALWLTVAGLAVSLALYIFGRAYDYISLETAGLVGAAFTTLHAYFGLDVLRRNWFPLFYLAFIIPPPGWVMDSVTAPLKEFVSYASTGVVELLGIPIAREGVTLYVAQYQLLVEDACSGMNSLTGLVAISLFYIYLLRNASWRYSAVMLSMVIPIAIAANIIRVVTLILLTYFFGDAVAQGFLHKTAGLFLFGTALVLVFALDNVLSSIIEKVRGRKA